MTCIHQRPSRSAGTRAQFGVVGFGHVRSDGREENGMRIFMTGANGFIGGAVASALIADGHTVRGLVREERNIAQVAARGIKPVLGTLDDTTLLRDEARAADGVVNA